MNIAYAAYTLVMSLLLCTLVPRVYEPRSRRPDMLRATWALAAVLPHTPNLPAVPVAVMATFLAWKGHRCKAALLAALTSLF